jgi:hypothetical protein
MMSEIIYTFTLKSLLSYTSFAPTCSLLTHAASIPDSNPTSYAECRILCEWEQRRRRAVALVA